MRPCTSSASFPTASLNSSTRERSTRNAAFTAASGELGDQAVVARSEESLDDGVVALHHRPEAHRQHRRRGYRLLEHAPVRPQAARRHERTLVDVAHQRDKVAVHDAANAAVLFADPRRLYVRPFRRGGDPVEVDGRHSSSLLRLRERWDEERRRDWLFSSSSSSSPPPRPSFSFTPSTAPLLFDFAPPSVIDSISSGRPCDWSACWRSSRLTASAKRR